MPSPQPYVDEPPPPGVEAVRFRSGALDLKAWYAHPPGTARVPGLVYFHGGYAFDQSDFDAVRPFLEAGFAVMTPTLRGENGNPGDFELYFGELDDALASIAWMRARGDIDPTHVYAFGHSAGGIIAALVSFYPETRLRLTGSAGGLYDIDVLRGMEPFDQDDREERLLRVAAPNADQFKIPHIGYIGESDLMARRGAEYAAKLAAEAHTPLTVEMLPGDHHTALPPAIARFLARVKQDLSSGPPASSATR